MRDCAFSGVSRTVFLDNDVMKTIQLEIPGDIV